MGLVVLSAELSSSLDSVSQLRKFSSFLVENISLSVTTVEDESRLDLSITTTLLFLFSLSVKKHLLDVKKGLVNNCLRMLRD